MVAVVVLLWKLRRTSKIYRFLFYGLIIIAVLLLIGITLTEMLTPPPIQTRPGVLETEITTDKTSYVMEETVHVSVYINNTNNWAVSASPLLTYQISDGRYGDTTVVHNDYPFYAAHSSTLIKPKTWFNLLPDNNYSYRFHPGNYTITVYFSSSALTIQSASCNITLLSNSS